MTGPGSADLPEALREALAAALGTEIIAAAPLAGGDINDAFGLTLGDGRRVFMKTHRRADPAMFPAEARGLAFLAEPGAIRLPEVLAVSDGTPGSPAYLVLEYLEPGPRRGDFEATLGEGLAALHRSGAGLPWGLGHDNFIGSLPQPNRVAADDWATFYGEARLRPQLSRAVSAGRIGGALRTGLERLIERLPHLVDDTEGPARVHGDLWGGNLHLTPDGTPALIDPAAYAGHREVDLAMMELFGGFGPRVFEAYDAAWSRAPGYAERVLLHQLYPLLVHVNLFGGGYVGSVQRVVDRYA